MCRVQVASYAAHPRLAAAARSWLRQLLDRWELVALADDACLLMTELFSNALLHADGDVQIAVAVSDGRLEVGVSDQGPSFQGGRRAREVPAQRRPNGEDMAEHGRGLLLVDHIADEWGVATRDVGKQVWFRLSTQPQWPYRALCRCPVDEANRMRLGSGAYAIAIAGPWDEAGMPDAELVSSYARSVDEREDSFDSRQAAADERDRIADERDRQADQREIDEATARGLDADG